MQSRPSSTWPYVVCPHGSSLVSQSLEAGPDILISLSSTVSAPKPLTEGVNIDTKNDRFSLAE